MIARTRHERGEDAGTAAEIGHAGGASPVSWTNAFIKRVL
jgi:hypothetical protein